MKTVLVYGATGDQGAPLIARLEQAGLRVLAASSKETSRDADLARDDTRQTQPVYANFDDLESLHNASKAADAIAMNLPFLYDVERVKTIASNIVEAATTAGIKKIVFNTSCVVMDHDLGIGAHDGRRAVEHALKNSDIDFVVLRTTVFMDNLTRVWAKPSIVNKQQFAYPADEKLKISWVCLDDVARCMVAALLNADIKNEILKVGGPEALTGPEVAQRLSSITGKDIVYRSLSPETFARSMSKLVTGSDDIEPSGVYAGMAKFYSWYNSQETSPLTADKSAIEDRLGVTLTSFSDWAQTIDWTR